MKVDDLVRIEIVPGSDRHTKASQNVGKYEIVDEQEPDEHGRPAFVVQNKEKGTFHTIKVVKESNLVYYVDSTDDYFQKQGKKKNDYSAPILLVCQKAGAELIDVPQLETEVMEPETLAGKQREVGRGKNEKAEGLMSHDEVEKKEELAEWSEELGKMDVETVKRYIAPKECTDTEIKLFCNICAARGANPFLNEAYLVKYRKDEPARTIVSKEFFLKKARNAEDYDGFEAGIIIKSGDEIVRREGSFIAEDEQLLGGWATVFINGKKPVKSEVNLEKYMKTTREGRPNRFWAEIPETMIRKVALTQALREAFPEELGGLYGAEETRD